MHCTGKPNLGAVLNDTACALRYHITKVHCKLSVAYQLTLICWLTLTLTCLLTLT